MILVGGVVSQHVYYAEALRNNLRILKNFTGELVGRACISKTDLLNYGVVTVGGLRVCGLGGISGILVGMPTTAARNEAEPVVEYDKLSSWASEQSDLVQKTFDKPKDLEWCGEVIRACFGKTGNLPIAFSNNGWKNSQDISNWHNSPNEVLLVNDAAFSILNRDHDTFVLYDHVLAVPMSRPSIIRRPYGFRMVSYPWPNRLQYPRTDPWWGFHCQTLAGAVVEALSNAWSVPLEEVLRVSDLSGERFEREIGLCDGKPVIRYVGIIRKPTSIQSKLP